MENLKREEIALLIWVLNGVIESDDEKTRTLAKSHKLIEIKYKLKLIWDKM